MRFGLVEATYMDDTKQISIAKLESICDKPCGAVFMKVHQHWITPSWGLRAGAAKKVLPIKEYHITQEDYIATETTVLDLIGEYVGPR